MITTFLQDYLLISNWETILFLGLLVVGVGLIYWLDKKEVNFTKILLLSMLIGAGIGLLGNFMINQNPNVSKQVSGWYGLIGYGYMDLLKMIVLPLVFLSMIRVIITTKKDFKRLALKTVGVLAFTIAIAAVVTIIIAMLIPSAQLLPEVVNQEGTIREVGTFITTLRSMIPNNIADIFVKGNILAIIVLAFLIGVSLKSFEDKKEVQSVIDFIEASFKIVRQLAIMIMDFMPYALIPLLANILITQGGSTLLSALNFIVILYIGIIVMLIIHLILVKLTGRSIKEYILAVREPLMLAFTSRSSLGTLPVTIEAMTNKLHLPAGLSDLVGSFGANMGMNGCAGIYPTLVVIALATMLHIPMDISFFVTLVFVVVLGSFGIAGIPGAATMSVAVVLTGMGLVEYYPLLGVILAIDPILDMGRTMLNVNGTIVAGVVVDRLEKNNK
ncbi:cation:dicarboxylase symporter family transporter [Anaerorhabdus sp.]|uniref:dicarboxylate/amino acid:cation symporter n=1 Tax=Anaerorhabdus sp. TaxID=1872524 RepID=UPI002B20A878|nr:cation:dicarboxylase symporter family transporter [Anaerorhabdus sp.]MEA4874846.1 cation:dicarboxylase symporter family transporter [Anaerorhabdus sp.]